MADIAIIIGNGFDIDMGLPSRYSDFVKSKEWQDVVKRVRLFLNDSSYSNHSLIGHLQSVSQESRWFDIEEEIYKFVISHPNNTDQEIGEIRNEIQLITEGLRNYLNRVSENFKADEKKIGYRLLGWLQNTPRTICEIVFNYTNPHSFLKGQTYYTGCLVTYVHGNLVDNDIVLGCDLHDGEKINRPLSFMYKYNMLRKANHIAHHLLQAQEIIFFGHSFNEMDFRYFRIFLKAASESPVPQRHLTVITYDEDSERTIKDNIQSQGISVTDLYSNLATFEFVHTKDYYQDKSSEAEKLNLMMERLLSKPQ